MIMKIQEDEVGPVLEIPEEIMLALGLKIDDTLEAEVQEIDGVTQLVLSAKGTD